MQQLEWLNASEAAIIFLIGIVLMLLLRAQKGTLVRYIPVHLHDFVLAGEVKVDRLYFVAMVLAWLEICLALAQPIVLSRGEGISEQRGQLMVVLDVSGSMQIGSPSPLAQARYEIEALLPALKGEHVGLLVFNSRANLLVPPSSDANLVGYMLPFSASSVAHKRGSSVDEGLLHGLEAFDLPRLDGGRIAGNKAILLITDGDSRSLNGARLEHIDKAVAQAKAQDVQIFVMKMPGTQTSADDVLDMIATETGGVLIESTGSATAISALYHSTLQPLFEVRRDYVRASVEQSIAWIFLLMSLLFFWIGVMRVSRKVTRIVLLGMGGLFLSILAGPALADDVNTKAHEAYMDEMYLQAQRLYKKTKGYAARYGEAASSYQRGDYTHAAKQFQLAWILAQSDIRARNALFAYGNSLYHQDKLVEAVAAYRGVLNEYNEDDIPAKHNLDLILAKMEKQKRLAASSRGREFEAEQDVNERETPDDEIATQALDSLIETLDGQGKAFKNVPKADKPRPHPKRFINVGAQLAGEKKSEFISNQLTRLLQAQTTYQPAFSKEENSPW